MATIMRIIINPGLRCDCILMEFAIELNIEPKAPNIDDIAFHKPGTKMKLKIIIATTPPGIVADFLSSAIKIILTLKILRT